MKSEIKLNTARSLIIIILLVVGIYYLSDKNESKKEENIVPQYDEIIGERVDLTKEELPSSFILKMTTYNERPTAITASLSILTFIDNSLVEGESFYNIKEGEHCSNNCSKYDYNCKKECTHRYHCIIKDGKWADTEDEECSSSGSSPMTIEQLKKKANTVELIPLSDCPPISLTTCYEIIKI